MNGEIDIKEGILIESDLRTPKAVSRFRKWVLNPFVCSVIAAAGIFGGIASLVAGLICVAIHTFYFSDTIFNRAGTVFLIIAIPMILIGAVFLDEIEKPK